MVYDQTAVSLRYPTPETPSHAQPPPPPNGHPVTPTVAKKKSPVVRKSDESKKGPNAATTLNRQSHVQNTAKFEILLPTKRELDEMVAIDNNIPMDTSVHGAGPSYTKHSTPLTTSTPAGQNPTFSPPTKHTPQPHTPKQAGTISVELPHSGSFNKKEYLVVPDEPDAPVHLSARKRGPGEYDDGQDVLGESLGVRQRSDAAFHDLRRCIQTIYEAEEHLNTHRSNNEVVMLIAENEPALTSSAQHKVHTLVERAITLNCFQQAPIDDLLHIVRLSENSLKYAEGLDLKIDEAWGQQEVDQWLQLLPEVDNGLKAARTSLRMMCGGREDKQLYSEETIEQSLSLFKHAMDGIIVPLAELRSSGPAASVFKLLSHSKDKIRTVFTSCQRLFSLMGTLISAIDTSETVMNTLEFASSRLVFLENAHTEKDSVVETQRFDGLRLVAMDMLSQVFLLNPLQRQGIFDEILTSLEKLPIGKQRARHFKLADGTSIQPVSALIMRLVQASSGKVDDSKGNRRAAAMLSMEDDDDTGVADGAGSGVHSSVFTVNNEETGAAQHSTAVSELGHISTPLLDTARRNASYVINFIVKRALKSTKTGDTPYRNLLDLFVDDFTSCLNNQDWPASELLLRLLMLMMVKLVDDNKSSAPAKNMALEILGVVNAAISRVRSYVRRSAQTLDTTERDELGMFLSDLGTSALELKSRPENMVSWSGPYRAVLENLLERHSEDPHLSSAISFLVTEWASKVCSGYDSFEDDLDERDQEFGKLAYRLRMMIQDRRWLTNEYSFRSVSANHARLAYAITLLRSQLCESFSAILNILLGSMASDQATVRSKSLKSINQVLETDPSILDGDSVVIQLILQCSHDSSTQVRDSALGLIGKCIAMRPALEDKMIETVVQRFIDTGPGVRKRAMKLARDIYLRNHNRAVRSAISHGLLHRVQDPEESVRDLARQMIEEIWFAPFHKGESTAASKISLADHVALMIQTVKNGNVSNVLDKVLQTILAPESKTAQVNFEVCTKLVSSMFDLVDNPDPEDPSAPSGRDALQVLMILAKADAKLFTFEQIRLLKPYITTISTGEDLAVSRAVVVIYRRVLPHLSSVHAQFFSDVRKELMPAVSKVTRALLDDIIACLWIISNLLENSEHLARLVSSSLTAIQKLRIISQKEPLDERKIRQFDRYSLIVGMAGKHCDFDKHLDTFKAPFPKWSGTSVSKLMVDVLIPFAASSQPLDVRKAALDAVGLICQSSPRNYVAVNVYTTFQQVLDQQIPVLETMILKSLKEFLLIEEKRSEEASSASALNGTGDSKRELTVMGGTSYDDVASATTHRFLKEITRIALAAQDDHAFLAVEVLASISRQGLVHPKETGVSLITLETSSVTRISELAYLEHKALHEKHETVLEREYLKAIQAAFTYQRDVAKDPHGATTNPFTSKLHLMMEVMKISKAKNRQRFLEKICALVDFDVSKLDTSEEVPAHVQFSRFVIENVAFFDYLTVGELQATVATMEKLVASTGATVAHAIESEIFQMRMDIDSDPQASTNGEVPQAPAIDFGRLRQLTAASMVLLSLWEARTYLRRLYGMGTARKEPKGKNQAKDLSRSPVKVQGVNGEKFWEEVGTTMTALHSRERMTATCKSLVELMNVDKEFKIAEEDEDLEAEDPATPSNDEEDEDAGDRGRKRKASSTPGGRKKRARSGSQARKRGRPRKQSTELHDADGEFEDVDWF